MANGRISDDASSGYAHFPWSDAENSFRHGTINDYRTINGGVCNGGCQGDTAVHEWGHAFGRAYVRGKTEMSTQER
eukprot:scaffold7727_cov258-Pinguiococcus_pyrenoidosus.AAC.7